jgi:hypothetical protein
MLLVMDSMLLQWLISIYYPIVRSHIGVAPTEKQPCGVCWETINRARGLIELRPVPAHR